MLLNAPQNWTQFEGKTSCTEGRQLVVIVDNSSNRSSSGYGSGELPALRYQNEETKTDKNDLETVFPFLQV